MLLSPERLFRKEDHFDELSFALILTCQNQNLQLVPIGSSNRFFQHSENFNYPCPNASLTTLYALILVEFLKIHENFFSCYL